MKCSSSSPDGMSSDRNDRNSSASVSPSSLYKLIVPLLRCETTDMRNSVVDALGMINYAAVRYRIDVSLFLFSPFHRSNNAFNTLFMICRDLMDELIIYIREAIDRKQVNVRRQRRRDALRLQLVRIFQLIAERGTFGKKYF